MPYTVNNYDGTLLTTVNDGQIDTTSTSLRLLGKGASNYGELFAENFLHLMENFARTTAPANPQVGQLWYHLNANGDGNHKLKVCRNNTGTTEWIVLNGIAKDLPGEAEGSGRPSTPEAGEMYWDGQQLWVYNSNAGTGVDPWVLVGPLAPLADLGSGGISQQTEIKFDIIEDTEGENHEVIVMAVAGIPIAIFSKTEIPFSPLSSSSSQNGTPLTKFATISGGMNINSDFVSATPFVPLNNSSQPTGNELFDLGSSGSKWRNVYTRTIALDYLKTSDTTGDWVGEVSVRRLLRKDIDNNPQADDTFTLGTSLARWESIHATTGYFNNINTDTGIVPFERVVLNDRHITPTIQDLHIGSSANLWGKVYTEDLHVDNIFLGNSGTSSSVSIRITDFARKNDDIVPDISETYNLGSSSLKWNKLFSSQVEVNTLEVVNTLNGASINAYARTDRVEIRTRQHYFNTVETTSVGPAWDLDQAEVYRIELTGNTAISNPLNMKDGGKYTLMVKQTASFLFNFPSTSSVFKFSGSTPVAPGAGEMLIMEFVSDGEFMYCVNEKTFS